LLRIGTFSNLFLCLSMLATLSVSIDAQAQSLTQQHYWISHDPGVIFGGTTADDAATGGLPAHEQLPEAPEYTAHADKCAWHSADDAWSNGLIAWRAGDYERAAECFREVATNGRSGWFVAGGAFWAARARLFAHQPREVSHWLSVAADQPETFYGLLARHILGLPMPFRWELNEIDKAALAALDGSPDGQSALALIASRDTERAERFLRSLVARGRPDLAHGAMVAAESAGMADLAYRLARLLAIHGIQFDRAAYPLPRWQPEGGFSTDRALIYALMRQESNFRPGAVSPAGARGVMQLMPATARFVARASGYPGSAAQFRRPEVNIALGERYLEMLLADDSIGPDLFLLTAAWNGGPANVERWRREVEASDDPLLFIESIPFSETRAFIERVLANLWIYRHRLGARSASLDALAAGRWPTWDIPRQPGVELAEHE
jgi:soluble lytic murein transglycosylase-like protein